MPMNPIMPLNDTTAPVSSAETRKMDRFVRSVSIPSDRADSSPKAKIFNTSDLFKQQHETDELSRPRAPPASGRLAP